MASSVGGASLLAQSELNGLRSEVRSKENIISDLKDELELLRVEKNKMADQITSVRDRLNVSEVLYMYIQYT